MKLLDYEKKHIDFLEKNEDYIETDSFGGKRHCMARQGFEPALAQDKSRLRREFCRAKMRLCA